MFKYAMIGLCFLLSSPLFAGMIEHSIYISPNTIKTEIFNNYDLVSIPDYNHLDEPGYPQLPVRTFSFVIPPDAQIKDVEVVYEQGRYLPGTFYMFPAQRPMPISFSQNIEFTPPDKKIYSLNTLYPSTTVQHVHEGNLSGYRIATIAVTPLRYNPSTKKLYLTHTICFRIHYRNGAVEVKKITPKQKELAKERIRAIVENKNAVEMWSPPLNRGTWECEYIIITDQSFVTAFEPLKEWKTKRGVPTDIVTTSWIYSNYSGIDNATRVRNFITEAADSGAIYFLLGGQCDFEHSEEYVPRRDTYFYTSNVGYYNDEDTIPCDLYFSDLDGTWDANGNGIYGEFADGVNAYADVYVGRAPVKNTSQVNNFVSKVITYEKFPSSAFSEKILLPVGNLWTGNYGNGINDTIADTIPNDWQKSKLYESNGFMSRYITRDSLNQGYNLCHMVGHGNEYGEYYNYGSNVYYYHSDVGAQTNDSTDAAIVNSMGCFCGALDQGNASSNYDCLAERMVNVNKKCAVATIMNTRYGWGYSFPQGALGPSGELSVWFYRKLFGTNAYHIGHVLAAAKDQRASSISTWWWRWCLFEYDLFGDPEMPIWTDAIKNLTVNYSSDTIAIYGDNNPDTFTVTVQYSGSPVNNALVTIMQDSTVYERQSTNGSGQAQFIFPDNTFQHQGYAWVTVTKYSDNFLPDIDSGLVILNGVKVDESPVHKYTHFNLVVSPNPIRNIMHLSFGAPLQNELMVKMYDIQGSLVRLIKLKQGMSEVNIPTSDLSDGVYFLKADSDISVEEKIIIVK